MVRAPVPTSARFALKASHSQAAGQAQAYFPSSKALTAGRVVSRAGGTTRRAAKMVILDMDHPEIVDYIDWKLREEKKVQALIAGGYPADFNGEAYRTISGQNSNNSVRIPDAFMESYLNDGEWKTTYRVSGEVANEYKAKWLMDKIAHAAWACADPGVQFDDTIQRWNTCKRSDRINATNPCSEFVFLDDTACNLASINLANFLQDDGTFDVGAFRQAVRVFITAMEIIVDLSAYPMEKIAHRSHEFRPIGLGYANLGTLLMLNGISLRQRRSPRLGSGNLGNLVRTRLSNKRRDSGQCRSLPQI